MGASQEGDVRAWCCSHEYTSRNRAASLRGEHPHDLFIAPQPQSATVEVEAKLELIHPLYLHQSRQLAQFPIHNICPETEGASDLNRSCSLFGAVLQNPMQNLMAQYWERLWIADRQRLRRQNGKHSHRNSLAPVRTVAAPIAPM